MIASILAFIRAYYLVLILSAVIGVLGYFYIKGKHQAELECKQAQQELQSELQARIEEAEERNAILGQKLSESIDKYEKLKGRSSKRIIKYVEKNPTANDVCLDADGLSILNSAQKGEFASD